MLLRRYVPVAQVVWDCFAREPLLFNCPIKSKLNCFEVKLLGKRLIFKVNVFTKFIEVNAYVTLICEVVSVGATTFLVFGVFLRVHENALHVLLFFAGEVHF